MDIKSIKLRLKKNKILVLAVVGIIAAFIGISIYYKNMHCPNSLIGGWVASFIISALFYWFGIEPTIKSISSISINKIAFNIAKQFMDVVGVNHKELESQLKENIIESGVVSSIFPKTKLCVEKYYQQFNDLSAKHQNEVGPGVSWSDFATFDSTINDKFIAAKEFEALRSKFKKEVVESVHIDLFCE